MKNFLILFICILPSFVQAETLKIAIGEYPPYSEKPPSGTSYVPSIIKAAFKTQGYDVKFEYLPWGRNFLEAQKGRYDATAFWFCNETRSADFLCSDAIYYETTYMFYNRERPIPEWRSFKDLAGKVVGVTRGYSYIPELFQEEKRYSYTIDAVATDKQNLERLIKGHIDAFPMSLIPATYLLETAFTKEQRDTLSYRKKPLLTESTHVLFLKAKPKSTLLRIKFNKGLKTIRRNGVFDKIMADFKHNKAN